MRTTASDLLEAVIPSQARIRLLGVLLLEPEGRFYVRELVARTGLPQGSVQRELARLAKAGIVTREASGRQVYYRANEQCPIVPDLRSVLIKTVGLADAIRESIRPEAGAIRAAFIFGSFARAEPEPESDVDLFVIGQIAPHSLAALLRDARVARVINPVVMLPEEFRERAASGDQFVREVLESPRIYLIGDEDELARLSQEP